MRFYAEQFEWTTILRISVCRLRLRRWLPTFKGFDFPLVFVLFAMRLPDSLYATKALRKWPLHPSSRSEDMMGPLTEHPVSLYGAADVGEGHHWRLLWFNVTSTFQPDPQPTFSLVCNLSALFLLHSSPCCRSILTPRSPPRAPPSHPFDLGRTLQATASGLRSGCFPSSA